MANKQFIDVLLIICKRFIQKYADCWTLHQKTVQNIINRSISDLQQRQIQRIEKMNESIDCPFSKQNKESLADGLIHT